jgi:hypothetical protein
MPAQYLFILLFMSQHTFSLFQFDKDTDLDTWQIVNDGVMGGRSKGQLSLNDQGHGVFEGYVSLENNGGFTMIQHRFKPVDVEDFSALEIRVKGDGKPYQIRLKSSSSQYYNYACRVETTGQWQNIQIPFENFLPQFRGAKLNKAAYPGEQLGEVAILIGNKRAEDFRIEIDAIYLR